MEQKVRSSREGRVSGSDKIRRCEVQVSNQALGLEACLVGRAGQIGTENGDTSDGRSRPEDSRRGRWRRRASDGRGGQGRIEVCERLSWERRCTMHGGRQQQWERLHEGDGRGPRCCSLESTDRKRPDAATSNLTGSANGLWSGWSCNLAAPNSNNVALHQTARGPLCACPLAYTLRISALFSLLSTLLRSAVTICFLMYS